MGSVTATMLIGTAHPNHGGIYPTHHLLLTENSRPAWSLRDAEGADTGAVWIPTVEDMLEDGLLMAGLLAVGDTLLVAAAAEAFRGDYRGHVQMYKDVDGGRRRGLYEVCRRIGAETKIALTVLKGSTLMGQLPVLREYGMSMEVCRPVYRREYSAWDGRIRTSGVLPGTERSGSIHRTRNAFECLSLLAARERWCWNLECTTCGHENFRRGLKALVTSLHPTGANWTVRRRGRNSDRPAAPEIPLPPLGGWPREEQATLQRQAKDCDLVRLARAVRFPEWLGHLGILLRYTEDAEGDEPVLTRSYAPQLLGLVRPGSEAELMLRERLTAGAPLRWEDLGLVKQCLSH